MYQFCFQRELRKVWGYMWTSWYSAKKWALWARLTCPRLCRLRTTMTVENFWRFLKHETLHHLLHPRLNQLVWLLVMDVSPRFDTKFRKFDDDYHLGRSRELSPFQKSFKAAWMQLQSSPVADMSRYIVNIKKMDLYMWPAEVQHISAVQASCPVRRQSSASLFPGGHAATCHPILSAPSTSIGGHGAVLPRDR